MTEPEQARLSGAAGRFSALPLLSALGPLIGLVFVWMLFALLTGHDFVKWDNQRLMLLQTAVVGTAAIGATIIIISGGIDLSVGSMIALGTMVVALLLKAGAPPVVAALGGVAAGAVVGVVIGSMVIGHVGRVAAIIAGLLVVYWTWSPWPVVFSLIAGLAAFGLVLAANELLIRQVALAPFIVTLGMWGALRGAAKGLGDNQPVYPDDLRGLDQLMQVPDWPGYVVVIIFAAIFAAGLTATTVGAIRIAKRIPGAWPMLVIGVGLLAAAIASLLAGDGVQRMPAGVWVLIVLAAVMAFVLRYTRFGRHVYAIGSNEQTARLAGIRVEWAKLLIYVVGIGCAGMAAMLQFSYLSMGDPTTAEGYELRVIAAVVIGGASLSGGEGSIRGTLIGALIMTVVDNGCTKLGLDNWVQEIVTGAIIVAAVALDRLRHRRLV